MPLMFFPILFFWYLFFVSCFPLLYSCYWMIWTAFYDASAFNSDLSKWAVSSVINLQESTSTFNFNSLSPVILLFIVFPFYYNKNYIANILFNFLSCFFTSIHTLICSNIHFFLFIFFFLYLFILNISNFLFCDLQYLKTVDLNVHCVVVNGIQQKV